MIFISGVQTLIPPPPPLLQALDEVGQQKRINELKASGYGGWGPEDSGSTM